MDIQQEEEEEGLHCAQVVVQSPTESVAAVASCNESRLLSHLAQSSISGFNGPQLARWLARRLLALAATST